MNANVKQKFSAARVMCFFAFLVLLCAAVMSYKHPREKHTVIPKQDVTVFVINSVSAAIALALTFKPSVWQAQVFLLFIQAASTTLTGYNTLGTFLYSAFVILCFANGFFKTRVKLKITCIFVVWIAILVGYGYYALQWGTRGVMYIHISIATSLFFFAFYFYVYKKLETLLVPLVPAKPQKSDIKLPPKGTTLHLSRYGLTERQIDFVMEYLSSQKMYKELADQFFVSVSTVKKDMTEIFEKFNVQNIKELHILLLQYFVER